MAKSHLRLVARGTVNRTVAPKRRPNADLRTREYLTEAEVERLLKATKANRWCQSALDWDPLSASKRDPFERRVRPVALAPSELAGVAETVRARVV